MLDAAASAAVEAAADALNAEVEHRAAAANLLCTWRFSPGYGDLPLDAQPGLLAALNATRLCGITATPTNLLMPTKSVTALVGLFPQAADADGRNQAGQTARPDARPACATCRFASGCSLRAPGRDLRAQRTCLAGRARRCLAAHPTSRGRTVAPKNGARRRERTISHGD